MTIGYGELNGATSHLRVPNELCLRASSIIILILGFGTIAVLGYLNPYAALSPSSGQCKIGVPFEVTIPLLSFDIIINAALTVVFIGLLRPLLRLRNPAQAQAAIAAEGHHNRRHLERVAKRLSFNDNDRPEPPMELPTQQDGYRPNNIPSDPNIKALKKLIYKSSIGAALMLIPTIINMCLLFKWRGREQGWLCFTCCTADVTCSVIVIHFLTVDRREDECLQAGGIRNVGNDG